jgi:hypothetical protein
MVTVIGTTLGTALTVSTASWIATLNATAEGTDMTLIVGAGIAVAIATVDVDTVALTPPANRNMRPPPAGIV